MTRLLIGSANALSGLAPAADLLTSGGSAVAAVELAIRAAEDNLADHTVGSGGYPNILGEVELDASIMEGATRQAGAVAAVKGCANPITLARMVMERLPHVMLVGEGAARFARECAMVPRELLTEPAAATWRRGISALPRDALAGPLASHVHHLVLDPEHVTGTVNVIARDEAGRMASGASTSGWAWKYPGRCGDSASIGAGNFCDDRFGAAACTGWGELAMRTAGAAGIVSALRHGAELEEACRRLLTDLPDPGVAADDVPLHVVAVDAAGAHLAASTTSDARYALWEDGMANPEERPRLTVQP
ncbi:MAG TPA: isoaspartyl peptidase/L-asparaginase [Acidimicrobiales bacterium]|nr:isoaspartyl peptidase/L-asparaginase [Acidimicrobiales bacterium]